MREDIIEYIGIEPGPTSIILVGVHGDEKCGPEALDKMLPILKIKRGRVLIGYGNPIAIQQDVRFVESNLNRMFKPDHMLSEKDKESYEYNRAQFLKKYFIQSDVLLDIHASSTPASQKFLICEENSTDIVKYLPFPVIVSGFDNVEPGGTDYYMNQIGKIGICAECGYESDKISTVVAIETIKAFLRIQGHIEGKIELQNQTFIQMKELYLTETNNFYLSRLFNDFEIIEENELIGVDGDKEVRASKESIILFAKNRQRVGEEAFLLGEIKRPHD